jgi:hypothetical protein
MLYLFTINNIPPNSYKLFRISAGFKSNPCAVIACVRIDKAKVIGLLSYEFQVTRGYDPSRTC